MKRVTASREKVGQFHAFAVEVGLGTTRSRLSSWGWGSQRRDAGLGTGWRLYLRMRIHSTILILLSFQLLAAKNLFSFKWLICCLIKVVNNFKLK